MNNPQITTTTVLIGAANLLRLHDWGTKTMVSPDGKVMCLVGAIQKCVAESGITDPVVAGNLVTDATERLTDVIWSLPSGEGKPHPTAWNDRHCSSKEEAISVLERAAGA